MQLGYAWVHRAAHILSNDEKQGATGVRHAYENLLTEMEQTSTPSETLATMLSTFRKVTTSYWPGSFTATIMPTSHAPTTSWNSISAQHATMNDERLGENRRHQAW